MAEPEEPRGRLGAALDKFAEVFHPCISVFKRCAGKVLKGSPPTPSPEVEELLKELRLSQPELLKFYMVFHQIRQSETDEIVTCAVEVQSESLQALILDRKKWVARLLRGLLALGNASETVSWDQFVWIFARFCSLDQVELAQALFLIILKDMESERLHYVTAEELADFYSLYDDCPVAAFNTKYIDFQLLPLRRYYAADFAELLQRFRQLLNPIVHLQQTLQEQLPSLEFWDQYDRVDTFCRKITYESFTMSDSRVFFRGEPPFRESCDMLAPDALGPEAVNADHWDMRTKHLRGGRGLRQISVWGEQPCPEKMALLAKQDAEEAAQQAPPERPASRESADAEDGDEEEQVQAPKPTVLGKPALKVAWGDMTGVDGKALAAAGLADLVVRHENASLLSVAAAILEEDEAPVDELPPSWMRNCTIAPAPSRRGPDPPLDRLRELRDRG